MDLRVELPDDNQPLLVHVDPPDPTPLDATLSARIGTPVGSTYIPYIVETAPSRELSWELATLERQNWVVDDTRFPQGFEFVKQSEGRASVGQPLASVGFTTCSAFLIKNIDAKDGEPKWLMFHHDSGYRSTWNKTEDKNHAGPVSPCTPTRGFVGRPRVGFEEFQQVPGRKIMLLIESEVSCDRREQLAYLESRGVTLLPALTMQAVPSVDGETGSRWSVVYRPQSDVLMIHFRDHAAEKVMHFKDVFSEAVLKAGVERDAARSRKEDIVDRIPELRDVLLRPGVVSAPARQAIELCLKVIKLRHEDIGAACRALRSILDLPVIQDEAVREAGPELKPLLEALAMREDHIEEWLQIDLLHKSSEVILGLTQLVDHLLRQERQAPESK